MRGPYLLVGVVVAAVAAVAAVVVVVVVVVCVCVCVCVCVFGLFRRQVVRGQRSLSEAGLDPHFSLKLSSVLCRKKSTVKLRVKGLGFSQSHSRSANADCHLAMIRLSRACFLNKRLKTKKHEK